MNTQIDTGTIYFLSIFFISLAWALFMTAKCVASYNEEHTFWRDNKQGQIIREYLRRYNRL